MLSLTGIGSTNQVTFSRRPAALSTVRMTLQPHRRCIARVLSKVAMLTLPEPLAPLRLHSLTVPMVVTATVNSNIQAAPA
jgi:hypothetical protein